MGNNNVEAISKARSSVDRQRVKDSLSFFKLQTRSSVDRRKVKDRRSFLKQEYLDHIPERRVNMINRRMLSDRRGLFFEIMDTFWKEAP